jgi:hypothetical protein
VNESDTYQITVEDGRSPRPGLRGWLTGRWPRSWAPRTLRKRECMPVRPDGSVSRNRQQSAAVAASRPGRRRKRPRPAITTLARLGVAVALPAVNKGRSPPGALAATTRANSDAAGIADGSAAFRSVERYRHIHYQAIRPTTWCDAAQHCAMCGGVERRCPARIRPGGATWPIRAGGPRSRTVTRNIRLCPVCPAWPGQARPDPHGSQLWHGGH